MTKVCSDCKAEKPSTDFSKDKARKDGLNPYCLECTRSRNRAAYGRNRAAEKARKARAYRENRERFLARNRRWRSENYARERATNSRYYQANKTRVALQHKLHYEANKAAALEYSQRRRARKTLATTVRFTPEQLADKWAYWGNKCWICGGVPTASDHVKPLSRGGPHMLANLRPACKPCNSAKHDKWPYSPPCEAA